MYLRTLFALYPWLRPVLTIVGLGIGLLGAAFAIGASTTRFRYLAAGACLGWLFGFAGALRERPTTRRAGEVTARIVRPGGVR